MTFTKQAQQNDAPPRRRYIQWLRRWWLGLLILCLLGIGTYVFFTRSGDAQSRPGAQGASVPARATSVVAAKARIGDMAVYLTGLGTVTPLNTVTVKSRVDGQLMKILFQEGQVVPAGAVLAELDPRPFEVQLTQTEGQMAKDQALLKNAQVDLERYRVLYQQDSIPKQQLDTQESLVRQYEAALKIDQGQIDNVRLQLTYCRITAPTSGRLGLRLVDTGNIVHANDQNGIVVITQLQPITVVFTIPEDNLPQVLSEMQTGKSLPVEAYDRDLKKKLATGSLLTVDNQIDQTTGTVKLKAVFPNSNNALFPNQFVNARLLVNTRQGVVIVPSAAIQRSPQSAFVYVVKPDNTVEARNIEIQTTEGNDTSISRGLSAGEVVVTDGVDKLQPGTKVVVRAAEVAGS